VILFIIYFVAGALYVLKQHRRTMTALKASILKVKEALHVFFQNGSPVMGLAIHANIKFSQWSLSR
jgi:hypothetical protein